MYPVSYRKSNRIVTLESKVEFNRRLGESQQPQVRPSLILNTDMHATLRPKKVRKISCEKGA